MPSDLLEVLDANIVIIPKEPLTQSVNMMSLFEESDLASLLRKPLTVSQGLNLDASLGTVIGTFQIESMKSQKTISISPLRIEVHDRSGEPDLEKSRIPETMIALANALHVEGIKAIGTNWQVMFKLLEGIPGSTEIAKKLLRDDTGFLPQNMTPIGGAVRMFLSDPSGVVYTLVIEPRGQDALTNEIWISCNANLNNLEDFSIGLLREMFRQSHDLLFEVKKSLFPAP